MGFWGNLFGAENANSWQAHVEDVKNANPGMPLKKVLRLAKKTFRKDN